MEPDTTDCSCVHVAVLTSTEGHSWRILYISTYDVMSCSKLQVDAQADIYKTSLQHTDISCSYLGSIQQR